MGHAEPSVLPKAFAETWRNFDNISSRATRTTFGNFLFANVLLTMLLTVLFAPSGPAIKFGLLALMIAIWFPLPALMVRRLNDASLPRLLVIVPLGFAACVLALPLFGFNIEKDMIPGDYWLESQVAEILMIASLALLLAKPASDNRFGKNPRYD